MYLTHNQLVLCRMATMALMQRLRQPQPNAPSMLVSAINQAIDDANARLIHLAQRGESETAAYRDLKHKISLWSEALRRNR